MTFVIVGLVVVVVLLLGIMLSRGGPRQEPGVVRFDVLVDRADPGHVVLVEIYRDRQAADDHKATAHYATWRDAVAPWMARPRSSVAYLNVSPDDAGWLA